MKDKKNILIIVVVAVVIILIGVVAFFLSKKEELEAPNGSIDVIASLQRNTQAEIDREIKADLEEKKYGLRNAKIYLNPYGSTPLSALIVFMSDKETDVNVVVKGKNGNDLKLKNDKSKLHFVPVYGLYPDYENNVEITLGSGEKQTFTIKTGRLEGMPTGTSHVNNVESANDIYFFTSPMAMTSFGVDAHGEIRWLTDKMYYHAIHVLENGHLLIGTDEVNADGLYTKILEIDYLGRIYDEYEIEEGYLNDFFVKEDGNIIVASKKDDRDTFSEYIIEIDGKSGKIVKKWDVLEALTSVDSNITSKFTGNGHFYNSGINYYAEEDSLLLTYWGGEFVINLSYEDGSIKWIFSDPANFTSKFDKVLLKGTQGFVYPKSMHEASLEGNTLRVFDNGYSMNSGITNTSQLIGSYSSANTYKLEGKNVSLVSSIDENKSLFSYALADYSYNDNEELVLFGRELKGIDMSKGGNINDYQNLYSKVIEKKNGEIVLNMDVDWASRSVDKIDWSHVEFDFELPGFHTTLLPDEKKDISNNVINMIGKSKQTVPYKFGYSKGIIEHDVLFMNSDDAMLILINDDNLGAVYTLKEKDRPAKKRIVTDLEKGKYYVYILENGTMYKTDQFITID